MATAICAVVKNEARYIEEWVAFHVAVGFSHIFVYDNGSSDATLLLLEKLSTRLPVEIIRWPNSSSTFQLEAYLDATERSLGRFDWLLYLDADEFFIPERDFTVDFFIERFSDRSVGAIAVPWFIYGSSNRQVAHATDLLISTYLQRAHELFSANRLVKTFARPEQVTGIGNPHMVNTSGAYSNVDGSAVEWLAEGVLKVLIRPDVAHINHYFVKSREEWVRKLNRGYQDGTVRNERDFRFYDRNEVFDATALRYQQQTKNLLGYASLELALTRESDAVQLVTSRPYNYSVAEFDPKSYLVLNPDLNDHVDPLSHFINHGIEEGRRYKS